MLCGEEYALGAVRRWGGLLAWLLTILLAAPCAAQTDSDPHNALPAATADAQSYPRMREFLREEDANRFADQFSDFVVSGGTHATSVSLTVSVAPFSAYAGGFRIQETNPVSVTYSDDATCWLIANKDATADLGSYTRVTGTHLLKYCGGTQYSDMPTLPAGSVPLMKALTDGGAVTRVYDIRQTSPVWDRTNAIDVTKVCAVGDDATDNVDCFSRLFMSSGYYYVPEGIYRVSRDIHLTLADNIYVKLHPNAVIKYTGGTTYGAVVAVRNADNIVWDGGVIDANEQGNDNGFAVSGQGLCESADFGSADCSSNADCTGGGTGVCRTDHSKNIWLLNTRIKSCRSIDDFGGPGRGGGKGFTIQFGIENMNVDNVIVDDCDIGFSVESKVGGFGATENINVSNVTVQGAKYMGAYIFGTTGVLPSEGDVQSLILDTVHFDNCAVNQAGDFGAITFVNAYNVLTRNIRVRSSVGTTTVMMGSVNHSDIDVFADVYDLGSLLDFNKDAGPNGSELPSRHNRIRAAVKIRNTVATGLVTTDTANGGYIALSDLDLGYFIWDGGADYENVPWPITVTCTANVCAGTGDTCYGDNDCSPYFNEVIPNTVSWTIRDLSFGKTMTGHGPYSPRISDDGRDCFHGVYIEEVPHPNGFIALRPCDNDYDIAIRNSAGGTGFWTRPEGVVINHALADAGATAFADGDATPDVALAGGSMVFSTANTAPLTITDFDQSVSTPLQLLWVMRNDANTTIDCTASGIHCNNGVDLAPGDWDVLQCLFGSDSQWKCIVGAQ